MFIYLSLKENSDQNATRNFTIKNATTKISYLIHQLQQPGSEGFDMYFATKLSVKRAKSLLRNTANLVNCADI